MRSVRTLILILITGTCGHAQETYVSRQYFKEIDTTLVDSVTLYVINQPDQFMSLQFSARYHGQPSSGQKPDSILSKFSSYSVSPIYQNDADRRVSIKANDEIIDLGLAQYSQIEGIGKKHNGRSGKVESVIDALRPPPPSVAVITPNEKSGLLLELMSVAVTSDDLLRLAKAEQGLVKVGKTVFALTPTHLAIVRAFANEIKSDSNQPDPVSRVAEPPVSPDVPSEANNAPLDVTLKWLASEMRHSKEMQILNAKRKLEPMDFKSCKIRYEVVPTQNSRLGLSYPTLDFQFNLADLNPETVAVFNSKELSTVSVNTRNFKSAIKMTRLRSEAGVSGRIIGESQITRLDIYLPNSETANRFKVAFVHAINLCEVRP